MSDQLNAESVAVQPEKVKKRPNRPIPPLSEQDVVRFHSKYPVIWPGGCWEWQAAADNEGRGTFIASKSSYVASRIAYFIFYGKDPGELQVQHTCNNPSCVCPLHLILGTQLSNMQYMKSCGRENKARGIRSGRHTKPERTARGERHSSSKLTDDQVVEMRRLFFVEKMKQKEIASKFGVCRDSVRKIMIRKAWAHIP